MTCRRIAVGWLAFGLACGGADSVPGEDPDAGADSDSDTDTSTESESDSDSDSERDPCAAVPRPLAPANGALTGSIHAPDSFDVLRPLFRWEPAAGCTSYDLEVDDSCTTPGFSGCAFPSPEVDETGIATRTFSPAAPLAVSLTAPVGRRYYWRVRACDGAPCGSWSAVRYLDVGRVASDVNADGYTDLVVGAYGQDAGAAAEGNAFVYLGGADSVPPDPFITLDNPANQENGQFGISVASAGDLNADGYADLVVGAHLQDAGGTNEGNAFVYLGSEDGVPSDPSFTLDNPANQEGGLFGRSVASAGDLNRDGYTDLVVGASDQDAGAVAEGNAFVYLGSADGVPLDPSFTLDNPANQADGNFGFSVASAGDVNGDGYDDLVVGAFEQDAGATDEGNAFVYLGSADDVVPDPSITLDNPANQEDGNFGISVASAGDLNADGYEDLVVGAWWQDAGAASEGNAFVYLGGATGVPADPSITLDNPANQVLGLFGRSVASAGDLNGDGYDDLLVGAPQQDAIVKWWATHVGSAFLYRGSADGVLADPSITLENPAYEGFGGFAYVVAGAGDLNGDGYGDIAVGAQLQGAEERFQGQVFVYLGRSVGGSPDPSFTLDNPTGQGGGNFGCSVASAAR